MYVKSKVETDQIKSRSTLSTSAVDYDHLLTNSTKRGYLKVATNTAHNLKGSLASISTCVIAHKGQTFIFPITLKEKI